MRWPPPTIADYYRGALDNLKNEVYGTDDARALGMDPDEWTKYLVHRGGMEAIVLDSAREPVLAETSKRGYPVFELSLPVVPSETLEVIFRHSLAGQNFYSIDYEETFKYDGRRGYISIIVEQNPTSIAKGRADIQEYVQQLDSGIEHENRTFPGQVRQLVDQKQTAVRGKHQRLDDLAKTVGIKIIKQSDISAVIPGSLVAVRREVAAIVPPTPKIPQRLILERERFDAIMEVIDQQCRQFERTPGTFSALTEEGLRDVLLSSLNAIFRGSATGETFQGLGKIDIHLRVSEGELFVAELKFWTGPASLREVVQQLLERLTWRDAYGVAIVLSKNADFGAVRTALTEVIPSLAGFVPNSLRKVAENQFAARVVLPSDSSKTVEIRVVTYNLYASRKTPRTAD